MRTKKLGNTDLQLTTIGLGTWAIGGSGWRFAWGPQDDGEARDAVLHALDQGINWIDTAAVYGDGHSEEIIGQALKQLNGRSAPIVATKCGRIIQPDGSIAADISAASIQAECEASLRRLQVETIDLYQVHWPDPDSEIEVAWQAMEKLVEQGKVRHIGVSNFSVEQMKRVQPIHSIASLQPPYSMIAASTEDALLPFCGDHNIGVICYSPMCKGLLTGTFSKERAAALSDEDHRSRDPKFADPQLTINLEMVEGLKKIAAGHNRTVAQLAIAWVLRRSEVTSAIVGARRPSQIEGTAPAGDWELTDDDLAAIDQLLSTRNAALEELGATDTGRV